MAGGQSPLLTSLLERLAATLDVPLVTQGDLTSREELELLAAFDGWVTTGETYDVRSVLLDRADLVVVVSADEPGTLRSLVRRTVRRMRADAAAEPDLAWVDALPLSHPDLEVVRLAGADAVEHWLASLH